MTDLDLDARQLCPDGACTGVLGDDGRCKVCGAAGEGRSAAPARAPENESENESENENESGNAGGDGDADVASFDDGRRLCPDGACIGVLDEGGRCKECGRAA